MHLSTLSAWLEWIGSVHQKEIDLGLDRIRAVAERLQLLEPRCAVITVGGTNGKGSVVAGLEAVYLAAGYRVGAFTSPFLFVHNEEVRINGVMADDDSFCRAFEKIEAARQDVSLTPFEYHTLAALLIFAESNLDVMILEVGLGGRLDAVNIIDADVSVIASIGIDHVDWLGYTREAIAIEKAGIMRPHQPTVCGDDDPPATLIHAAQQAGTIIYQRGKDFHFSVKADHWSWQSAQAAYQDLPCNNLLTSNMASVLMVLTLLQNRLPVKESEIKTGLQQVTLPGRMQMVHGPVTEIYDVAHNPAAALVLAERLRSLAVSGKTLAVFSMLDDKDIDGTLAVIRHQIDRWYVAPLTCKRAAPINKLEKIFMSAEIKQVYYTDSIENAYQAAGAEANAGDRIVIFGSFYTVAAIMRAMQH